MTVFVSGAPKRLGLALSGGGFRATAFHLGVFAKLKQLDLLWKVDVLTCVSGGSIAGAFLASHWKDPDVLAKLETYLSVRSVAVESVLKGFFNPFQSRIEELADSYERDLFGERTLGDLTAGPRLYLNATNVATGNLFSFVTGQGIDPEHSSAEMGDHEFGSGFRSAGHVRLSRAVAASSAFPVFNPLVLTEEEYPLTSDDPEYISLTDGGIYDNLGVNPLFRRRNALSYAIVSDGGKPFEITAEPTKSSAGVALAMHDIQMEQIRGLQFERLRLAALAKEGPKSLWFSIDSTNGEAFDGAAMAAAAIGTGLSSLSPKELAVLKTQGGALVEARLKKYAPELLAEG